MEDKKLFYKDVLQRDITILRTAANTLKSLEHRFTIEGISAALVKISEDLLSEGWNGYVPKPIAEIAIDDTLELVAAEELKKKEAEAQAKKEAEIAEKKRVADEKAKKKAQLEADLKALEVE